MYEHLVHPSSGAAHVSLATLPRMRDRCLRLGSAGKTFSFTGWKVGWVAGPAPLLAPAMKAHQFLVFTVAGCLQRAVAHGLDHEEAFYTCVSGHSLCLLTRIIITNTHTNTQSPLPPPKNNPKRPGRRV